MFESQTFETIMNRMLARVPDDLDKREGSIIWDALAPAALELAQAYVQLNLVLQLGFAETTYGEYLNMKGHELGVYRLPAVKATGQVIVAGQTGTEIPTGTIFTAEQLQFVTAETIVITDGTATINIESSVAGIIGNVPANSITGIPAGMPGVTGVTNAQALTGGLEEETDAAYLARILYKARFPATSGNVYHYTQWAREVLGVGDAMTIPLWNGAGTVKVVLLNTEKRTPDQSIVDNVAGHIEEVRPIGATVTVVGAQEVAINISATLTLASYATLSEVEKLIKTGIAEYLDGLAFKDPLVRYTRIAAVLLDIPPILDYANLLINASTGNIEMQPGEVAVLGTVTLSE